jgi:hypothetical protein
MKKKSPTKTEYIHQRNRDFKNKETRWRVFLFPFSLQGTEQSISIHSFIQELKNSLYQSSYGGSNKSEEGG